MRGGEKREERKEKGGGASTQLLYQFIVQVPNVTGLSDESNTVSDDVCISLSVQNSTTKVQHRRHYRYPS